MEKIIPFKNKQEALTSLDNGGRFYNLLTSANDGKITSAELARAAGVFSNEQKMWLFFEMSIYNFSKEEVEVVTTQFSDDLQNRYTKQNIQNFLPSQVKAEVAPSQVTMVTGLAKLVDSKNELTAFIMVPISAGSVTTFSMIPIFDQYDVYEMKDEISSESVLIAHHTGKSKLPLGKIRCGGIIKEFNKKKSDETTKDKFLEVLYFSEL